MKSCSVPNAWASSGQPGAFFPRIVAHNAYAAGSLPPDDVRAVSRSWLKRLVVIGFKVVGGTRPALLRSALYASTRRWGRVLAERSVAAGVSRPTALEVAVDLHPRSRGSARSVLLF